jgi:hypothetical protein
VTRKPRGRRRREKTWGSAEGVVMRTSQWSKSRVCVEGVNGDFGECAVYLCVLVRETERDRGYHAP